MDIKYCFKGSNGKYKYRCGWKVVGGVKYLGRRALVVRSALMVSGLEVNMDDAGRVGNASVKERIGVKSWGMGWVVFVKRRGNINGILGNR